MYPWLSLGNLSLIRSQNNPFCEHGTTILTLKYVCRAVVNEKGLVSVFVIFSSVEILFALRMTCKKIEKTVNSKSDERI